MEGTMAAQYFQLIPIFNSDNRIKLSYTLLCLDTSEIISAQLLAILGTNSAMTPEQIGFILVPVTREFGNEGGSAKNIKDFISN